MNFKGPRESIGKLVDVKIDEAKQYSLNGTFIQEHQRSMAHNNMYSEKEIIRKVESLAEKIGKLEVVQDYHNVENKFIIIKQ